jgi:ATP-dependent RNA helicase DeaD
MSTDDLASVPDPQAAGPRFRDLALSEPVLKALEAVGYETPTPIQASIIPHVLAGKDVLGQAQTGTGKTAAFALPLLSRMEMGPKTPQTLVLAPTRELAIQVAEAFQRYASHMPGFHVLPIYGGQSYEPQLRALRRGVHVVVGTPGRVMDHLKRGTLKLDALTSLVLDEADEMLRMGFIDDVEWILQQTPASRQVALFSATMPSQIRRIAQKHLKSPAEIHIRAKTTTATNIRQRYWLVSGVHKLDALTRILEAESFDGMLVFTRTKIATVEVAERLAARGFAVAPLSGDVEQRQRERTIAQLKDGTLDIVVATDVAARGLDVDRISHVFNYDIPTDTESYVHRIGRTGRAGRSGEAILFVTPRERHLLRNIERATRQTIEAMQLPSAESVNVQRIYKFKQRITETLAAGELELFRGVIEAYEQEHNVPAIEIAAALAKLSQGENPLLLPNKADAAPPAEERGRHDRADRGDRPERKRSRSESDADMETFRIEVGHIHGVQPGNIVGAIANEAQLESQNIGRIDIRNDHSLIDLPMGMPKDTFHHLQKVWVSGRQLQISRLNGPKPERAERGPRPERDNRPPRPEGKPRFTSKRPTEERAPREERDNRPPRPDGKPRFAGKPTAEERARRAERSSPPARGDGKPRTPGKLSFDKPKHPRKLTHKKPR